jgi:hypothetical protein
MFPKSFPLLPCLNPIPKLTLPVSQMLPTVTHIPPHTAPNTHTHAHTQKHTHAHTQGHNHTHAPEHAHAITPTNTHAPIDTHTHIRTLTHTYAHTRIHGSPKPHARPRARKHKHAHTHTHAPTHTTGRQQIRKNTEHTQTTMRTSGNYRKTKHSVNKTKKYKKKAGNN